MKTPSWLKTLNYRLIISGVLELLGVTAITYGFYLIAPLAGFLVGGLSLIWVARAIDPPDEPFRHFLLVLAGQRQSAPPSVVIQQGGEG